jgi:hypothetical protein
MQLNIGQALSDAFQTLTSRLGALVGTALIFYVLLIGLMVALGGTMMAQMAAMMATGGEPSPEALAGGMGGGLILFYLLIYVIQFAQQLALSRLCSDRHEASIGDAISVGFKGVPTMFGAVILLGIGGVGAAIVGSLIFAGVAMGTGSAALTGVLAVVLIVAAIYLFARLCLLNPVVAIDEVMNPITVISRSWQLTGGNVGRLVVLFLAAVVVAVAILAAIFFATIGLPQPDAVPSTGGVIAFGIAILVYGLTVGLYFVALIVAIHRQLAGTSDNSATVFD